MDETLRRLVDRLTDARRQLEDEIHQAAARESLTSELLGRVEALKRRLGRGEEQEQHPEPSSSTKG